MSAVTREEFTRLEQSVSCILTQLGTLNETLSRLATAIELSNNNMNNNMNMVNEKINSLQESRTEMWKKFELFGNRLLIVETTNGITRDNTARAMSWVSWGVMLIGFLLKLAKVW